MDMTTPARCPKKHQSKSPSQNSTRSGAFTCDTALPTFAEKRGAGRADELTILGISTADILRLGGIWPPVGAKRIQDPSAGRAICTTKDSNTFSEPGSTRCDQDLPTTFCTEPSEAPNWTKTDSVNGHDFWPSGMHGWSQRSMRAMKPTTLQTIQRLRRLRHIALAQGNDTVARKAKFALWELTGKPGYRERE